MASEYPFWEKELHTISSIINGVYLHLQDWNIDHSWLFNLCDGCSLFRETSCSGICNSGKGFWILCICFQFPVLPAWNIIRIVQLAMRMRFHNRLCIETDKPSICSKIEWRITSWYSGLLQGILRAKQLPTIYLSPCWFCRSYFSSSVFSFVGREPIRRCIWLGEQITHESRAFGSCAVDSCNWSLQDQHFIYHPSSDTQRLRYESAFTERH